MNGTTITILGATGYTGRLCVEEAVRRGCPVVLAGRRPDALEELAAHHPDGDVSVVVADVVDRSALRDLAERSDVLLSTVGPYNQLGRAPVEACLATATPYLDVSGELDFLTWVYAQDARAQDAGVTLAPGVGFDGVPGDLLAALAARELPGPVASARIAYSMKDLKISAGTARSSVAALHRGGAAWRNGRLAQEPTGTEHWEAPFPEPPGTRGTLSVPFPEVVTVGRSTGANDVRCFAALPAAKAFTKIAGPAQRAAALLAATPVWGLVQRGVDRFPDGPSAEDRAKTRTVVLAELRTADGVTVTRWARLDDVYGVTAKIAVSAAKVLLGGATDPGAVTPSQLFDPAALLGEVGAERGPA
jgi:short subunit dehydrogenase-like uncharacterized protein